MLDIIAGSGVNLDTLELYEREDWRSHSNWKTMLENYLECYHCAVAHPSFSAAIDVRQENYNLTAHGWCSSQIGQVRPSALEGRSRVKIYDVGGEVAQSQYHLLWPNMTININTGFPNLSIDVWNPDGANATKGFSEQYFAPGVSEEFAKELIAFNEEVGAEDDLLTDSVQRGLLGGLPERGRFLTNSEHLVLHFQKLIVNAVTGEPVAPMPAVAAAAPAVSRTIPLLADASAVPDSERNAYVELEIFRIEPESEIISSFYLRRVDGKPLDPWIAGQFLPIRVGAGLLLPLRHLRHLRHPHRQRRCRLHRGAIGAARRRPGAAVLLRTRRRGRYAARGQSRHRPGSVGNGGHERRGGKSALIATCQDRYLTNGVSAGSPTQNDARFPL